MNKIEDIKKALGNGAYLSALALTLTLPDIYGQVEYPDEKKVGERYVPWFNNYVYKFISNMMVSIRIYVVRNHGAI